MRNSDMCHGKLADVVYVRPSGQVVYLYYQIKTAVTAVRRQNVKTDNDLLHFILFIIPLADCNHCS
jgi:hypothetical protein